MTDFSADEALLNDAIYGGPLLAGDVAARLLGHWGLNAGPSLHVLAIDAPRPVAGLLATARARHRVLSPHAGIAYVLVQGDTTAALVRHGAARRGLVIGEPQACADPRDLLRAIQQAVLSLRRTQLGPGGTGTFTQLVEGQARALALHRVRTRHVQAGEAVSAWLGIVTARHQDRLNTVRRKLLEGLCLLTLEQDDSPALAYPFAVATRRLVETYTLPALRTAFEQIARELAPLLSDVADASAATSLVDGARAYLAEHYRDDVGLAQAARHLRCSATHLSRAFKQSTGRTLTAYLQSLRVARAKELLLETDGPLRVIAPAAGFGTAKHFHRVFLQQTGMTPHAFRAAYRT